MAAHRQSALLLHGLAPVDQRWILARIDQADARLLRGHLAELKELGIPADASLAPSGGPVVHAADPHAAVLARASVASLLLALADEPAWMVAQVLALRPWPWRAAFVAAYGDAGLPSSTRALAPGAESALLAAAAGKLAPPRLAAVRTTPGAVWKKLRGAA